MQPSVLHISSMGKSPAVCVLTGSARISRRIKLSLVIGTDILIQFWDLLAAIYHVSEMWVEHGICNGSGLEIECKIVMPWVVCDELELAFKGQHGVCMFVPFTGRVMNL